MEKYMNNIENKIDNLFDEIEESSLYKDYVKVKKQLRNNKEINCIINDIKRLQKLITNTKDENIELNLKELYDNLNKYPLYQSYLILKDELEEELYMIKEIFEKYFNELLKIKNI